MTNISQHQNSYLIQYLQFFIVILFIGEFTIAPFINNNGFNTNYLQIIFEIADTFLAPLFIFTSALFLNIERCKVSFFSFFRSKILHLVFLYLIGIFLIIPVTIYYAEQHSQTLIEFFKTYNFLHISPGPLWILPVIIIFDLIFFFILNKYNFNKFISKIEELDKTKLFILVFLIIFFSYIIPYAIIEEETFLSFPINPSAWFIFGAIWIPKTEILLLFFIFFWGVITTNSNKLFKYALSPHNQLSETYIYKIIESGIIYVLLTTLTEKINTKTEYLFEFLHSLLFVLLMISTSMSVIGIFNKLCAHKSNLLAYFSKYNYFIYTINLLPVVLLHQSLSQYPQLLDIQKIYIIILFTITICYAAGLLLRRLPILQNLIPGKMPFKN